MLKELPIRGAERTGGDTFLALREQMDRVFDEWFNSDFDLMGRPERMMKFFSPRTDVVEGEKEVRITLEIPGLTKDHVSVELWPDRLVVIGEKEASEEKKEARFHRKERFFGSFRREIALPCDVDEAGTKAHFENGLLTVTLPKALSKTRTSRRIEVKG